MKKIDGVNPYAMVLVSEGSGGRKIEKIEKDWPGALDGINRNYIHLISPKFNEICLNKNIHYLDD